MTKIYPPLLKSILSYTSKITEIDYLIELFRLKTWCWHHNNIIYNPIYFNYEGIHPPWEPYYQHKTNKNVTKIVGCKMSFKEEVDYDLIKPLIDFHGDQNYLLPTEYVNDANYIEFIFVLTMIWSTHLRNPFLEIYFIDDTIGYGVRVKDVDCTFLDLDIHLWFSFMHFPKEEDFLALVYGGINSFRQTAVDKEKRCGDFLYGLGYYPNSVDKPIKTIFNLTDNIVNTKSNLKGKFFKYIIYIYIL